MRSKQSRSSPGPTRSKVDWSVRSCRPIASTSSPTTPMAGRASSTNCSGTGSLLRGQQPTGWALGTILISLLPWVFLLGFMIFIFMQMQGSGNRVMQFGKARARMVTKEQPKVTFNDVAGLTEADRGTAGDQGLSPEPRQVPGPRRQDPERRPPLRPSRDRQDPPGQGRGG